MNEPFGKKLVKDVRDGTYYFGMIRSPDNEEEGYFGMDKTDFVQVGLGTLEVQIPASGCRVYGNIKTLSDAFALAEALDFQFYDCDHEYVEGDTYPRMFPERSRLKRLIAKVTP